MFGKNVAEERVVLVTGEYVNFVTIAMWAEMYCFLLAFVVFLATVKFINMLKFNCRMSQLADTISACAKDMKFFVITFFIYFFAFAQFAYLLFGSQLPAYSSFTATIQSLFQFVVGQFDFNSYKAAQPFLGPVFFFLYVFVVCIGLQAMFLTIICEAFQLVHGELANKKNEYELVDYVMSKFKNVFTMITGDNYNAPSNPEGEDQTEEETDMKPARRITQDDREVVDGNVEIGFDP